LFLPQIPPRPHHGRADKRPRRLSAKGTQSPTATGRAHRCCHCTLSGERAQFQSPCALTAAPKLQKRPPQPKPSSKECVDPPISSGGETCATCAHATATRCRAPPPSLTNMVYMSEASIYGCISSCTSFVQGSSPGARQMPMPQTHETSRQLIRKPRSHNPTPQKDRPLHEWPRTQQQR